MPNSRLTLLALVAMAANGLSFAAGDVAAQTMPPGRALLIGCTKYDHLDPSLHLQGPANDVALMRDLLHGQFGFSEEKIVVLAESSGRPDHRPTRANIEREFLRLGREAAVGEQVVVYLAGHGGQQPDRDPDADDSEPDGLDELFLPADIRGWDGRVGRVPNAIVDDELRAWLNAIEQRRAAVTVIVDSCHSGSMTRGSDERVRQIPPGALVPLNEMSSAAERAARRQIDEQTRGHRKSDRVLDSPSVVAIYASQASEGTVEKLLPVDGSDRKPHGLLTYTIGQVLLSSSQPLTCRELVQRVQARYIGLGRSSPTPMIEGVERDRELFGKTIWPDRSRIVLKGSDRGWTINAGRLHGVTQNSVLAVRLSEKELATESIGHVRVQMARTIDSDVVPSTVDGKPANTKLPDGGRCELVFVDAGDMQLRVAVTLAPGGNPEQAKKLSAALRPEALIGNQVGLLRQVEPAEADWLVRVGKEELWLIPAESGETGEADSTQIPMNSIGPRPLNQATQEWLGPQLERIARAANLKRLASDMMLSSVGEPVGVQLRIERAATGQSPDGTGRIFLQNAELMTIRLTNQRPFPVDVTLLFIDAQCRISNLFPRRGEINRLGSQESVPISTKVVAETRGIEHLVAITVKADREVLDFTALAQPSLITRGDADNASFNSPLGQLLDQAIFAENTTRGVKRKTAAAHALQILSWEIRP